MSVASLRNLRSKAPFALAVGVLIVVILGSGCVTDPQHTRGYEGEKTSQLLLAARTANSGPFLALDKEPDGVAAYAPGDAGPTSGVQQVQNAINGAPGQVFEFKMPEPLAKDYYLNLSKPVTGIVHWQSVITANAGGASGETSGDKLRIRAELWAGNKRVGGGEWGGSNGTGGDGGKWQHLVLLFRPEVSKLAKGDVLSVKVFRTGGLADFSIGTGATQQSSIEFRYFDFDPLAGAVYLENGRIYFDTEATTTAKRDAFLSRIDDMRAHGELEKYPPGAIVRVPSTETTGNAPRALAFGIVGLLPAAAVLTARPVRPSRRSSIAVALTLLFLLGAMSGCASPGKPKLAKNPLGSEFATSIVDDPTLHGIGAVSGTVRDGEIRIPVGDAHVLFLGTNLFATTEKKGTFAFNNVSAGTYKMVVNAENFNPFEQNVRVEIGKRTVLQVNLTHSLGVKQRAHTHGEWWGDGDTYKLLDGVSFMPRQTYPSQDVSRVGDKYYCLDYGCEAEILVPLDKVVPPGTGTVDVTLDWPTDGDAPKEAALRIVTSGNGTFSDYVARGPKDTFHIQIFPSEADAGHQTFTQWQFIAVMRPAHDFYNLGTSKPLINGGAVKATIIAHRSVVPLEPAHRDFWGTATEFKIVNDLEGKGICADCKLPADTDGYNWAPGAKLFVPPGSKEIKGKVRIEGYTLPLGKFRIAYHGADTPPARWADGLHYATVDESTRTATGFTFTISNIRGDQVDEFYQSRSYWKFYADDSEDYAGYGLAQVGSGVKLFLEATVYKDPSYTF